MNEAMGVRELRKDAASCSVRTPHLIEGHREALPVRAD